MLLLELGLFRSLSSFEHLGIWVSEAFVHSSEPPGFHGTPRCSQHDAAWVAFSLSLSRHLSLRPEDTAGAMVAALAADTKENCHKRSNSESESLTASRDLGPGVLRALCVATRPSAAAW